MRPMRARHGVLQRLQNDSQNRPIRLAGKRKDRPLCGAKTRAGRTCLVRVEFGKARCRDRPENGVQHGLGTHAFDGVGFNVQQDNRVPIVTFGYLDPADAAKARALIEEAIAEAALITSAGVDE
jgi:hypothetical protein